MLHNYCALVSVGELEPHIKTFLKAIGKESLMQLENLEPRGFPEI